jgi:thioredoxin reductase (NADPH)
MTAVSHRTSSERIDLIIIGAGPAGLAAGFAALKNGLSHVILERGMIAQTVYNYPIGKPLFSTPNEVELIPGTLHPKFGVKPTREEVLEYYAKFALREHPLNIRTYEEVLAIRSEPDGVAVVSEKATYHARYALAATGGFGVPRKLNVPGETGERVSYRFQDAFPYAGKEILVTGGGNSAAETSLFLCEGAARVTWALRRPSLDPRPEDSDRVGIKPWVREPVYERVAAGDLTIVYSAECLEITSDAALLKVEGRAAPLRVPCAHIFAMLGADPDVTLLAQAGAEIAADGRPVYDAETNETTVPGLFVVGHLTRELHMKNATVAPWRIVNGIAARLGGAATGSPVTA